MKSELEEIKTKLEAVNNDKNNLEKNLDEIQAKLDKANSENKKLNNTIKDLNNKSSEKTKEENNKLNKINKELNETKKKLDESDSDKKKLSNEITQLKKKLEEIQKQNELLNAHSINININNVTGSNKNNSINHNNNINHNTGKFSFNCKNEINNNFIKDEMLSNKNIDNKTKYFPYQKIKAKILNNKNSTGEMMSNTRNESSEKTKNDFLNKYFTGKKMANNNMHLNNSCVKMNHYPLGNHNLKQNNNAYMPFFNRNMNYNIMKKIISSGGNNSSRSASTKVKGKPNKDVNFRSMS
jgi:DNA repair exonuclease SbcCD ATPase subunit